MFELLFKYPASIFHKGQFVFLTPWPVWVLIIASLAAAGALFWHVRRQQGLLTGLRPVAIWVLESCLVALILFLLWHPALSVATLRGTSVSVEEWLMCAFFEKGWWSNFSSQWTVGFSIPPRGGWSGHNGGRNQIYLDMSASWVRKDIDR